MFVNDIAGWGSYSALVLVVVSSGMAKASSSNRCEKLKLFSPRPGCALLTFKTK
jgi:hypothetical protein